MISSWLRSRRRRSLLRKPFPEAWNDLLRAQVRQASYLSQEQWDCLRGFVRIMIAEKDWFGINGLEMTDEVQVVIAGHAGLMTLGFAEPYYFDRLRTIIVHPNAFIPRRSRLDDASWLEPNEVHLGEAWHRGPVILSWSAIQDPRAVPGTNLVIHEFAHHIDGLAGEMDGEPPLTTRRLVASWNEITQREFDQLSQNVARGQATLLDQYGASNRAEFFAVATECFFERPHAMRARHTDLYHLLAELYQQDVAAWLPDDGHRYDFPIEPIS